MTNDLELNNNLEFVSNEQSLNDTGKLTNPEVPASPGRQLAIIPQTQAQRRQLRLEILADEISSLERTINDSVLEIAEKVKEARIYFDENETGENSWSQWVSDNLPFGITRANMLLQISKADSPQEELARQRKVSRESSAKHRTKSAQPSRDGRAKKIADNPGEEDGEEGEVSSEARELIEWVSIAHVDDIKKVLVFIRNLHVTNDELTQVMRQPNTVKSAIEAFMGPLTSEI